MARRKGDQIYNGARDNASGTSRRSSRWRGRSRRRRRRRSGRFSFSLGDGRGAGAAGLASTTRCTPLYPLDRTRRRDQHGRAERERAHEGPHARLGTARRSSMTTRATAAGEQGRTVHADAEPEKGYYYRSDHFNFAKQGVPALESRLGGGIPRQADGLRAEGPGRVDGAPYHKPKDVVTPDVGPDRGRRGFEGAAGRRLPRIAGSKIPRMEARERVQGDARGDAQTAVTRNS